MPALQLNQVIEQQATELHSTPLRGPDEKRCTPVEKLVELGFDLKLSQMAWTAFNDYDQAVSWLLNMDTKKVAKKSNKRPKLK